MSSRITVFVFVLNSASLSGCAFHSGPWRMPSHQLIQREYVNDRAYCLDQAFTFPVPAPFPPPGWSMMAPNETYAFNRCMRQQRYVEGPSGKEVN